MPKKSVSPKTKSGKKIKERKRSTSVVSAKSKGSRKSEKCLTSDESPKIK